MRGLGFALVVLGACKELNARGLFEGALSSGCRVSSPGRGEVVSGDAAKKTQKYVQLVVTYRDYKQQHNIIPEEVIFLTLTSLISTCFFANFSLRTLTSFSRVSNSFFGRV